MYLNFNKNGVICVEGKIRAIVIKSSILKRIMENILVLCTKCQKHIRNIINSISFLLVKKVAVLGQVLEGVEQICLHPVESYSARYVVSYLASLRYAINRIFLHKIV